LISITLNFKRKRGACLTPSEVLHHSECIHLNEPIEYHQDKPKEVNEHVQEAKGRWGFGKGKHKQEVREEVIQEHKVHQGTVQKPAIVLNGHSLYPITSNHKESIGQLQPGIKKKEEKKRKKAPQNHNLCPFSSLAEP